MSDIVSIHDSFIRRVLADKRIAADYFRNFLPAFVSEQLDFSTLEQLSDTYMSDELKKSMTDIVYSCRRKDRTDEVRVSLLIEHKSYVDVHAPVQIGSYIFSGWMKQISNGEKLSLIIPILLYHGPDKWEYRPLGALFKELEPEWKRHIPDFDYIYNNLGEVPDEQIAALRNRFLSASVFLLKYSFDAVWLREHLLELLMLLENISPKQVRVLFLYLMQQGNIEWTKIMETMEELPPTTKKKVVTFAEYFREMGIKKGREEGLEKGKEAGRQEALSEKNRIATINMIRKGYSDADICEVLEVTAEYVSRIRAEIAAT